jgi:hypothetical protein
MPVARFIETKNTTPDDRKSETIERHPSIATHSEPFGVSRKEEKIGIAAGAMGAMAGMRASVQTRQITYPKRWTARKRIGDLLRGSLDRADQRRGAIARALPWTLAPIASAAIGQRNRLVEVSVVGRSDGDRLPHGERLARTGTERCDYDYGENPNHSKCMIAHGSP